MQPGALTCEGYRRGVRQADDEQIHIACVIVTQGSIGGVRSAGVCAGGDASAARGL